MKPTSLPAVSPGARSCHKLVQTCSPSNPNLDHFDPREKGCTLSGQKVHSKSAKIKFNCTQVGAVHLLSGVSQYFLRENTPALSIDHPLQKDPLRLAISDALVHGRVLFPVSSRTFSTFHAVAPAPVSSSTVLQLLAVQLTATQEEPQAPYKIFRGTQPSSSSISGQPSYLFVSGLFFKN